MLCVKKKERSEAAGVRGENDLSRILNLLAIETGSPEAFCASLPFSVGDATAGAENELQAAVAGGRGDVDLARTIASSSYFRNMERRAASGDVSESGIRSLSRYLEESAGVWENSWVRLPRRTLCSYANHILNCDLKSDKKSADSADRSDVARFLVTEGKEAFVRMPVSYLLKLALADVMGAEKGLHTFVRVTGERAMQHFSNDNTSPETFSFHPVALTGAAGLGRRLAAETLKRYLMTQLLTDYANRKFELGSHGQEALVYFSPTPPTRQKRLNECIPDAFYRELFMSPCLSGWDDGEKKSRYMGLCHRVLSRSQLNAVSKLREAGIITSNLVVLPNTSNICLANNGTHVSLGSRKLTALLKAPEGGFSARDEKYYGDLVIKLSEHFLPLFAGTLSAAPHRLDFTDFHPERALGFLPHELDYTHLRMIWRRWKKKADLNIAGRPVTPFGPAWIDRGLRRAFSLKGDLVPDYRLIDYLASLMSTEESPALNGDPESEMQLRKDLSAMGIFHEKMPLYQLLRLRKYADMGFSGLEGRHYSLFENITDDMGDAADLQTLVAVLAWKYILTGEVGHGDIPDTPFCESERRQVFFCTAIGIPTFYVKTITKNLFLARILKKAKAKRKSGRYPGYTRVHTLEYRKALIRVISGDAADLIEMLGLSQMLENLRLRVESPKIYSAEGKLITGIMAETDREDPMKVPAEDFNRAAEKFYMGALKKKHIREAFDLLEGEFGRLDLWSAFRDPSYRDALKSILGGRSAAGFLLETKSEIMTGRASVRTLEKMIRLLLLTVHRDTKKYESGR